MEKGEDETIAKIETKAKKGEKEGKEEGKIEGNGKTKK